VQGRARGKDTIKKGQAAKKQGQLPKPKTKQTPPLDTTKLTQQ
jgi:hypothetical protein